MANGCLGRANCQNLTEKALMEPEREARREAAREAAPRAKRAFGKIFGPGAALFVMK